MVGLRLSGVAPPSPTREVLVMSLLSKLRIGPRLAVAFGLVALVFLIALAIGWSRVGTVASGQGAYADTANRANAAAAAAYNMRISQAQNVNIMGRVENPDGSDMHQGDVAAFESALKDLQASEHSAASRAAIVAIRADYARWTNLDRRLAALVRTGDRTAATALENGSVNAHGDSLAQALTTLGGAEAHAGEKATADAVGSVRNILALLAGFAVATGIVLAACGRRRSRRPAGTSRSTSASSRGTNSAPSPGRSTRW